MIEVGVRLIVVAVVVDAVAVTNDSLSRVARDLDVAVLVLGEQLGERRDVAGHDDSLKMEDGGLESPRMGETEAPAHPPSLLRDHLTVLQRGGSVGAWHSARLLRLLSGLPDHGYSF